jgi:hypothetical protein
VKPALGNTIRGKKTITCEKKTFERARGFYKTPFVKLYIFIYIYENHHSVSCY